VITATQAAIAAAVAAGALLQGSIGVGFALVLSPVLVLLAPDLVPSCVLILMLPLNAYVAWREWSSVDREGVTWITVGRGAGALCGLVVLAALPATALRIFIGVVTIATAFASLLGGNFVVGRNAFMAAGVITGITETATGIGGPPLALVYQHHPGPVLRSTIAVCFFIGEVMSLVLLAATRRLHMGQIEAAVWLLPALGLGALISQALHRKLDGRKLRVAMLGFAVISGAICLV
jgi:uncharacterized membrane protein YfcA